MAEVKSVNKHEFVGVIVYLIGAILFSFIPLAFDIQLMIIPAIVGLIILIIGFYLVMKK